VIASGMILIQFSALTSGALTKANGKHRVAINPIIQRFRTQGDLAAINSFDKVRFWIPKYGWKFHHRPRFDRAKISKSF
jgi:hypothetical protein